MKKNILLIVLFFYLQPLFSQTIKSNTNNVIFKDTIENFVFDSIVNHFDELIEPRLIKHFKYLGKEPVFIVGQRSGDPHFICDYPQEPLLTNKIYSFTVCFYLPTGPAFFNKTMWLELSNGKNLYFTFKGKYRSKE